MALHVYKEKSFDLKGLNGISDAQLEVHFKLYAGYVANTNKVNELLQQLESEGKIGTPTWAELRRRLGFEYDGMILHEHYFGNLTRGGQPLSDSSKLGQLVVQRFGSIDAFRKNLTNVASMRGVGWAITYQDPSTGALNNHWITDHENGHPAGYRPILVLDMWEHAFMVDYRPADKGKYIESFFSNVDWKAAEARLV